MKLSDIMSHAGLATYAEVALVLFLLVFALQAVRLLRKRDRWEAQGRLPLDDEEDRR